MHFPFLIAHNEDVGIDAKYRYNKPVYAMSTIKSTFYWAQFGLKMRNIFEIVENIFLFVYLFAFSSEIINLVVAQNRHKSEFSLALPVFNFFVSSGS